MGWLPKILAFQLFSRLPGGKWLYHVLQQHGTRSTSPTRERVSGKVKWALRYTDWLRTHAPDRWLEEHPIMDFGAGWLPVVPLVLYTQGARRQFLVDIHEHMSSTHVYGTLESLREVTSSDPARFPWPFPEISKGLERDELLAKMGVTYGVPPNRIYAECRGTIGTVVATDMIMHLSRRTLTKALRDLHAVLRPGGYFLMETFMLQLFGDLYHQMPARLVFQMSERKWEHLVNSPLMTYNRLKGPDYRALLAEAGFQIREFEVSGATPERIAMFQSFQPHPEFGHLSAEDLAAQHIFAIAQKLM